LLKKHPQPVGKQWPKKVGRNTFRFPWVHRISSNDFTQSSPSPRKPDAAPLPQHEHLDDAPVDAADEPEGSKDRYRIPKASTAQDTSAIAVPDQTQSE